MSPVLGLSGLNIGYKLDNHHDILARTTTPSMPRDHNGLSKVERILGVQDLNSPPQPATPTESRPRGRMLHKMSSNLHLLSDIKNALSNVGSRSASRNETRSPAPPVVKSRPRPLKIEVDRRSIYSDDPDYEEPPRSASTIPSYYYKYSPTSPIIDTHPLPDNPMLKQVEGGGAHFSKTEQDRILNNLLTNGMIPRKMVEDAHHNSQHKSSPSKRRFRKNSLGHVREGSNTSKGSSAAWSSYGQSTVEKPSRKGSKGSTAQSQPTTVDASLEGIMKHSSSQRKSPGMTRVGIAVSEDPADLNDASEKDRVTTWLTTSGLSRDSEIEPQAGWLAPERPSFASDAPSTISVQTLHSTDSGMIFPIQGLPGDWASVRSHDRQSSLLVDVSKKPSGGKSGKVYYTDLQFESVLALSDSDSDSDDSVDSALHRKRLSMMSNGNDTQPTAWSSLPSSRSQSRKMSVNTRATSPPRQSLTLTDHWNYPIPNAQALPMSREPSNQSLPAHESTRRSQTTHLSLTSQWHDDVSVDHPTPVKEEEEMDVMTPLATEQTQSSSPLLTPSLSPSNGPGPVWVETLPSPGVPLRKGSFSSMSTSCISPTSHGPAGPAPARPLPAPPTPKSPTASSAGAKGSPSIFSFPKPPRVPPPTMNLARTRSNDLISTTSGESSAPSGQSSTGSMDTIRAADAPVIQETTVSTANSPVELPSPRSPDRDFLSPLSAGPATGRYGEKFSPIRLAFPEGVHKRMSDSSGVEEYSVTPPLPTGPEEEDEEEEAAVSEREEPVEQGSKPKSMIPISTMTAPPRSSSLRGPPPSIARLAIATANRTSRSPNGSRIPRLPSSTRGSPSVPSSPDTSSFSHPGSQEEPWSAPATVTRHATHEEEPEALPQMPVPQMPARPARKFHLPTMSNASSVTSLSAPGSITKSEPDFIGLAVTGPVATATAAATTLTAATSKPPIGITRSESDGSNLIGRRRRNGGQASQIRQIRLSKIGKAE